MRERATVLQDERTANERQYIRLERHSEDGLPQIAKVMKPLLAQEILFFAHLSCICF